MSLRVHRALLWPGTFWIAIIALTFMTYPLPLWRYLGAFALIWLLTATVDLKARRDITKTYGVCRWCGLATEGTDGCPYEGVWHPVPKGETVRIGEAKPIDQQPPADYDG